MSFTEYNALVDSLVEANRTTGPNQLQALVDSRAQSGPHAAAAQNAFC